MKRFTLLLAAALSAPVWAVSMNFTGTVRTEGAVYNKLGLGISTLPSSKQFLSSRFLLDPNIVVDDHFSVKSQWSLLSSPSFTPNGGVGMSVGRGGYIYGDSNPAALSLNRAWLEWTSDFGVLRAGRMPFSWGYGLVWDAGNNVWDDYQTTLDRLEYRLHLGHVIGALAYSKQRKLSVYGDDNDQNFYSVYLQYDNPELDVEGGILYEKQVRSTGRAAEFTTAAGGNPYALPTSPAGSPVPSTPPLATSAPTPISNNVVDVYLKKSFGYFTLGGEVGWISGSGANMAGQFTQNLNAFATALNASYEYHKVKGFLEFLYASGDANATGDHVNGFVILHRNRRPGLILGRELLGNFQSNSVGVGSPVYYGNAGSFSGVYYLRPGLRVDFSTSWTAGLEVVIAQKAAVQAGEERGLGVETDLGTDYMFYKNFEAGVNFGYLFAGQGLVPAGSKSPEGVFAFRTTASLKF